MTGTFWIRTVGVLTCMAVVVAGWDAEAARGRGHRRASCCCEPVCCAPVCCAPTCCAPVCCEPVCCEPACVSYITSSPRCCVVDSGYRVIQETVVVPARPCCDGWSVGTGKAAASSERVATSASKPTRPIGGTEAVTTSLKR